jgi:WhiB family redox-sensing transcriptional regulator
MAWLTGDAACKGVHVNVFYGDTEDLNALAKKICRSCPLIEACFRHAYENGEHGVWGGTTERERRALGSKPAAAQSIAHGTTAGARAHYRRGERPCPSCLTAANVAKSERKAS